MAFLGSSLTALKNAIADVALIDVANPWHMMSRTQSLRRSAKEPILLLWGQRIDQGTSRKQRALDRLYHGHDRARYNPLPVSVRPWAVPAGNASCRPERELHGRTSITQLLKQVFCSSVPFLCFLNERWLKNFGSGSPRRHNYMQLACTVSPEVSLLSAMLIIWTLVQARKTLKVFVVTLILAWLPEPAQPQTYPDIIHYPPVRLNRIW